MSLDLNNTTSVFNFILSRDTNNFDTEFINTFNILQNEISKILPDNEIQFIKNKDLRGMDNEFNWLYNKYYELLKFQINIELLTPNMINYINRYFTPN